VTDLTCETADGVAVLTLNRPHRRNALSDDLMADLDRTLSGLRDDPSVRVALLTGAPPGFCAGSDVVELAAMTSPQMRDHELRTAAVCRRLVSGLPVIAAVEGFAVGGGLMLAACCDVVVSGRSARWSLPEVRLGWLPPWGLEALAARVGRTRARQLVLDYEPLSAERCHGIGLVDDLVDDGEALRAGLAVAHRIRDLPAAAVRSTKEYFAHLPGYPAEAGDLVAARYFESDCASEPAQSSFTRYRRSGHD